MKIEEIPSLTYILERFISFPNTITNTPRETVCKIDPLSIKIFRINYGTFGTNKENLYCVRHKDNLLYIELPFLGFIEHEGIYYSIIDNKSGYKYYVLILEPL